MICVDVETVSGIGGSGDDREQWRGEFKYDILNTL
jgi:hypothetical protein